MIRNMSEDINEIIELYDHNGIITSKDLTSAGIHRGVLKELTDSGKYYKAARGIYVKSDAWEDEFVVLQKIYEKGIFSHSTSLFLLGYAERAPLSFHMTFPFGYNAKSLKTQNVITTMVIEDYYYLGIIDTQTPAGGQVRCYNIERSLCDVLRGKGDDIQIVQYAMRKYISSKERDIYKLMDYASKLHVEAKVRNYVEVLLL